VFVFRGQFFESFECAQDFEARKNRVLTKNAALRNDSGGECKPFMGLA